MTTDFDPAQRRNASYARTSAGPPRLWSVLAAIVAMATVALVSGCSGATAVPRVPVPDPAPAASGALTSGDVNAWLDGLLPAALDRAGIAGAAVSVVHDGKFLTARGYGRADTGTGDTPPAAVDPGTTMFRVGSVSKTFTATAVMQLVEQGRLDLDADVNRYLDFALPEPKGTITLRNLLTHTAGFESRARPGIEPPGTALDLRDYAATDPPRQIYVPGTVPAYSNYGNSLAGYIVQRVSGAPFATYVQTHVLDPAGMTSSSFDQPLPARLAPQMSKGYADDVKPAKGFEMVAAAPAGALSSTATDMGRFMLAQLGELDARHALLKPATLTQMHAPALGPKTLGIFARGPRMTLGFFDDSRNGHRILGHEGDTTVFHSYLEFYPDDATGIFISENSTGRAATDAHDLRVAVTHQFTDRYFPGAAAPALVQPTATAHATAAAGTYETSRSLHSTFLAVLRLNGQTQVSAQPDGTVVISPGPDAFRPARYEEIAPWVWREVGGQKIVTMRTTDGHVDALGFGSASTLLRVDPAHQAALVVPVLLGCLVVLLVSLLVWPLEAVLRRRYGVGRAPMVDRRWLRLRRIGVAAALLGVLGWVPILTSVFAYRDLPDAPIRAVQAVQAVGILGLAPAIVHQVATIRGRAGWARMVGAGLVVLALAGVAWFALVYHLVGLSVSY